MSSLPISPSFLWGERKATEIIHDIENAYEEIVKWRKNVLKLAEFVASILRKN